MEFEKTNISKNPRQNANILSKATFFWLFKTFILGYKRDLVETDLHEPLKQHKSDYLSERIFKLWEKEQSQKSLKTKKKKPSLFKVLLKCFRTEMVITGIITGIYQLVVRIAEPICLGKLLNYFSPKQSMDKMEAYYWAIGLIACTFLGPIVVHHVLYCLMQIGIKMTVACSCLIYRKILRMSMTESSEHTTVGQMLNLLSNDVGRLEFLCQNIHYLWIAPLQIIIVAYIMFLEIGWGSPIGLATLFIFLSILGIIGKQTSRLLPVSASRTDYRLRLMNEIIRGIQVVKMYAWEKPFISFVEKSRREEAKSIKFINILNTMSLALETCGPRFCLFVSIVVYVSFGNAITIEKAYLVMSYYNIFRTTLFIFFPLAIQALVGGLVSVKRIETFLAIGELSETPKNRYESNTSKDTVINFKNVSAKWSNDLENDVLQNINFTVKRGTFVAVIGQIGAGKSSLLHAILQELPLKSGIVEVNGKISYTPQSSWVFASTIKQNILFGQAYDEARYNKVVEVCQLKRDFLLLPHGDQTIIGDRGISLSGGQNARINLARAVYFDADIYLFDDPLSAVDTEVGRNIMEECFRDFLKNKTIVLVTHQSQHLNQVDQILVLQQGQCVFDSTIHPDNSEINLMKYMTTEDVSDKNKENSMSKNNQTENLDVNLNKSNDSKVEETRTYGKISARVFYGYFKAVKSWPFNFFVLCLKIISVMSIVGSDYFLSLWISAVEVSTNMTSSDNNWYITYYGGISTLNVVLNITVVFFFHEMSIRAARNLHNDMFHSIVRAVMKFFNDNPSGRIMNRFSKDIGIIDLNLPETVTDVVETTIYYLITVVIAATVNPILLIMSVLITVISYFARKIYIMTSRSVKRLEGITRSPIFDHLTASINGLPSIRAFGMQDKLIEEFNGRQDLHTSAWIIFISCARCFGMYLDVLCAINIAVTIFVFLLLDDETLPGNVALVISQSIVLLSMIQWGVRQSSEMENYMTSVERVLEYTRLEEEPPFDTPLDKKPPADWPSSGQIEFRNLYLMYDPKDEPVLKNLNLTIYAGEKIGIVGRTGAGKSSLIAALFRLAYLKGEIYIDNVATSDLGIHDFRSKISIIPQEPVLFVGSLRRNLDPFDKYTDAELWQALEDVEMKRFVESLVKGLYTNVKEGGTNFSAGQRQLLCLARTVVTKNKILVLDEATANVDLDTDELIQKTIRKNFEHCTVITIAHRLHTIIDCDRVLVMDAGTVMEFDKPYKLLEKQSGFFYDLVQQTGSDIAKTLTNIAKKTYEEKQKTD